MKPSGRYTRVAIALHWLVAALVVAQFTLGWAMQQIAKQPPGARAEAFNIHKSLGLTLLLLMALRFAWRLRHAPPAPLPMPRWQWRLASITHGLLYAVLIALPLTGYLGSEFSGYPVRFFGLALPSWAGKNAAWKEILGNAHLALTWALAVLVTLHLAGVAKHVLVNRDRLLARMGIGRRDPDATVSAPPAG
jgi:cytochrome b561